MRIHFEQLTAEYPVANVRYCSDGRDDRQNVMMMACATWAAEAGHEVSVHWDPPGSRAPGAELVFLVLFSVAAYRLQTAIRQARERADCRVVVCGPHAVSFPGHCLRAGADAVVGRCNRDLLLRMVADAAAGALQPRYETDVPVDRFPHHARFRELGFIPGQGFMNALASTGCPYTCAFCSDATTRYDAQEPGEVVRNVAGGGEPLVVFNDPTLGVGRAGRELLQGLAGLEDRHFISFTTSSMLRDAGFRRALGNAGWVMAEVGIENVNSPFAKNRGADFAAIFSDCDFLVVANYIYGYDPRDFSDETFLFLSDLSARCPNVIPSVFVPFSLPETELHQRNLAEGRVFDPSYLCIGNEILSVRAPGMESPRAYYERLCDVNDRLYEGLSERLRGWAATHPGLPDGRREVLMQMLARQEREGERFDRWVGAIADAAPERFEPFAEEVLRAAVPGFDAGALALA
ncbi:MAG TPA: hypothetical protein VGB24_01200 [Longimicrobium sp.]|jgi:hypothetical protein|uniref:hypothetical protein n=1 Tax=Longimicrobium sp. TaxID=2029185 RepID=UPI002ED852BC